MSLGPRVRKQRRKLTEKELVQLEGYAAIRLPLEHIASMFKMSQDTLERIMKKDAAVRAVFDEGRAKASGNVRRTLYSMAMGKPAKYNDDGKEIEPGKPGEFQALKFWCQTQEGFKTADKLELVGKDDSKLEGLVVHIVEPKTERD